MSNGFVTVALSDAVRVEAPDGSQVDILAACRGGSMARFSLAAGLVSKAVRHRTIEELWYITAGTGEMWRHDGTNERIVILSPGVSLAIPAGVAFQFRSLGPGTLEAIGVSMPPWPGMDEAEFAAGTW